MARYRGLPETVVDQALERVDLGSRGGDKFKSYSLGMKQRLGVASALMGDPDLVVLDEPTNGLDPAGMVDMRRLIVDLARGGQTVLLSSHLLDEVQAICDRVGVINNGVLLKESTVSELRGGASLAVRGEPVDRAVAVAMRLAGDDGVHLDGDRLLVDLAPDRAPELVRELVAGDVQVHEVGSVERTLEEVFFEMTRTETRRAGGSAMSAATEAMTDTTSEGKDDDQRDREHLASTKAELLRLRKWPAVWVTIGAWLALTAMFGYLFNYVSYTSGSTSFSNEGVSPESLLAEILPANVDHVLLQGMPMFGGALMMVLGAIVAGNGYGWGTWKTVFTQGPSRRSVVTGSLAALTTFVVADRAGHAGAVLRALPARRRRRVPGGLWPSVGDLGISLGAGFLVMEMFALVGYLLGTAGARAGALGRARPGLGPGRGEPAARRRHPAGADRGVHQDPAGHRGRLAGRRDRGHRRTRRDARACVDTL